MERKNTALDFFEEGNNCAQSVLMTFAPDLTVDKDVAGSLTSGFGAGMGRLHKTCGAVTGSFMVIGRYYSIKLNDPDERGIKTNEKIQQLEADFSKEFKSTNCGELIQLDLKTEEGRKKFDEENIKENICNKCVAYCVEWIEENLCEKN